MTTDHTRKWSKRKKCRFPQNLYPSLIWAWSLAEWEKMGQQLFAPLPQTMVGHMYSKLGGNPTMRGPPGKAPCLQKPHAHNPASTTCLWTHAHNSCALWVHLLLHLPVPFYPTFFVFYHDSALFLACLWCRFFMIFFFFIGNLTFTLECVTCIWVLHVQSSPQAFLFVLHCRIM